MSNMPLVTIAMVTYNSGKYVRQAIDSILQSSYTHFELVISDDNSSDNTWDVIGSFADERIKAVKNTTNIGEYNNRNQCIDLASGEYLLFIDGDDMIYPHGLECMTKMLHAFPECGMALMRWYKRNLFYPVVVTPKKFYEAIYFNYGFNDIAFANTFFRLSLLREVGRLSVKYRAGDNHIRLLLGKKAPTLLICDSLTWWRETPNQASTRWKNDIGFLFEQIDMEWSMLEMPDCVLDDREIVLAKYNLKIKLTRALIQFLKKGRIRNVVYALRRYNIPFYELLFYKRAYFTVDPFDEFTPENPCTAVTRAFNKLKTPPNAV